jgi:peptidoglycan/LPS O-acetylase OafA/YrhL
VGLLFYVFRKNYVYFVILACVGVTAYRIFNGVPVAVNTYYRVDEILAGSLLLFAVSGGYSGVVQKFLLRLNPLLPLVLLLASSHEAGSWLQYFRPYFAALLVGSTVCKQSGFWFDFLKWRALAYLAVISYALYVIHPFLAHTWLGEGETLTKYLKRPLLFAVLLLLAHSSTFYFEKFFMSYARRWSKERTGA